jgi:hypothetical protein
MTQGVQPRHRATQDRALEPVMGGEWVGATHS